MTAVHPPSPQFQPVHDVGNELLSAYFDTTYGAYWVYVTPHAPTCFSPELLGALRQTQRHILEHAEQTARAHASERVRYQIFASRIPEVFSLGGDLTYFQQLIQRRDENALWNYGKQCIDLVYYTATNYDLPMTTIALVQGNARGGGFEAALASNVIIAERGCEFSFPEILFNLFPGMGAHALLTRRTTPIEAERMIVSGQVFTAEELYERGIIDILAEPGDGEREAQAYINRTDRRATGHQASRLASNIVAPIAYDDLKSILDLWVDTALRLTKQDLKLLERVARTQRRSQAAPRAIG